MFGFVFRLKNQEVVTPTFDFIAGTKNFNKPIKLSKDDILIIEGLHALNEEIIKKSNQSDYYLLFH